MHSTCMLMWYSLLTHEATILVVGTTSGFLPPWGRGGRGSCKQCCFEAAGRPPRGCTYGASQLYCTMRLCKVFEGTQLGCMWLWKPVFTSLDYLRPHIAPNSHEIKRANIGWPGQIRGSVGTALESSSGDIGMSFMRKSVRASAAWCGHVH